MLTDGQNYNEALSYAKLPKLVDSKGDEGNRLDSIMATNATTIDHAAPPPAGQRSFVARLTDGDEVAHLLTLVFAASILLLTSLLVYELWINSTLSRAKFGWIFFWTRAWDPVFGDFGAAPFIYGTLVTAVVSLAIAVPLGLAAAIFLAELAPRKMSDSHRLSHRPACGRSQRDLRACSGFSLSCR